MSRRPFVAMLTILVVTILVLPLKAQQKQFTQEQVTKMVQAGRGLLPTLRNPAGWHFAAFQALRRIDKNGNRLTLRCFPGIDEGCADVFEIPGVSRNNGEVVGKGGGCNQ